MSQQFSLVLTSVFYCCQQSHACVDKVSVTQAGEPPCKRHLGNTITLFLRLCRFIEKVHRRHTNCQLVRHKARCTTTLSLSEWSTAGIQPPFFFCSLLHLCPAPRVRLSCLSKSFTERDKSRQAGGAPEEGDEQSKDGSTSGPKLQTTVGSSHLSDTGLGRCVHIGNQRQKQACTRAKICFQTSQITVLKKQQCKTTYVSINKMLRQNNVRDHVQHQ